MNLESPLSAMAEAIHQAHGLTVRHLRTVRHIEKSGDETLWAGSVEVFAVVKHPSVKHCYAWLSGDPNGPRYRIVPEAGPVKDARTAVQSVLGRLQGS